MSPYSERPLYLIMLNGWFCEAESTIFDSLKRRILIPWEQRLVMYQPMYLVSRKADFGVHYITKSLHVLKSASQSTKSLPKFWHFKHISLAPSIQRPPSNHWNQLTYKCLGNRGVNNCGQPSKATKQACLLTLTPWQWSSSCKSLPRVDYSWLVETLHAKWRVCTT